MRLLILLMVVSLMVVGCEGPTGPAGEDGNANVKTGTISPTSAEWLWQGAYDFQTGTGTWTSYFTRYVNIPVAEITPDFISTGLVLVFFEAVPGSGEWAPLPFQFTSFGSQYNFNIVYEVEEGVIRLHYFYSINTAGATVPTLETAVIPTYTFKYMVIEGTELQAMAASEIDISDHDRITEYLASPLF
ncbi:MAG: hypothetical protein KAV42_11500 [Candidatus Krumholzibacteria bacterium]|nr:hypothetical protein [Candidatus Krumholzibacteria bacterium]